LGSLIGSLISYALGRYGGEPLIIYWGRYFFLDETDLQATQNWFSRRGELTILIGRFVPVVRHLISLPAGLGRMDLKKFCLYTILGAGLWNTFLTYLGITLGENWELIKTYSEFISWPIAVLIFVVLIYFIYRHAIKKK